MEIRKLMLEDWDQVFQIYKQGIDSGKATFSVHYPSWDEWDQGHSQTCRYVALYDNNIAGFVAVSPTSTKIHYQGIVEVSIYVDKAYRNRGIGTILLNTLIQEAPKNGYWCLYSSIISYNEASVSLHKKCGFRTIGYRERIAKDRFGNWLDTTLMEYRFSDDLVEDTR